MLRFDPDLNKQLAIHLAQHGVNLKNIVQSIWKIHTNWSYASG